MGGEMVEQLLPAPQLTLNNWHPQCREWQNHQPLVAPPNQTVSARCIIGVGMDEKKLEGGDGVGGGGAKTLGVHGSKLSLRRDSFSRGKSSYDAILFSTMVQLPVQQQPLIQEAVNNWQQGNLSRFGTHLHLKVSRPSSSLGSVGTTNKPISVANATKTVSVANATKTVSVANATKTVSVANATKTVSSIPNNGGSGPNHELKNHVSGQQHTESEGRTLESQLYHINAVLGGECSQLRDRLQICEQTLMETTHERDALSLRVQELLTSPSSSTTTTSKQLFPSVDQIIQLYRTLVTQERLVLLNAIKDIGMENHNTKQENLNTITSSACCSPFSASSATLLATTTTPSTINPSTNPTPDAKADFKQRMIKRGCGDCGECGVMEGAESLLCELLLDAYDAICHYFHCQDRLLLQTLNPTPIDLPKTDPDSAVGTTAVGSGRSEPTMVLERKRLTGPDDLLPVKTLFRQWHRSHITSIVRPPTRTTGFPSSVNGTIKTFIAYWSSKKLGKRLVELLYAYANRCLNVSLLMALCSPKLRLVCDEWFDPKRYTVHWQCDKAKITKSQNSPHLKITRTLYPALLLDPSSILVPGEAII
jgi:hypothetical protein